ncbi:MAG: right-handed parallel beta-helix repeat-containing protein, partial [Phycisphaerales bacterium]
MYRNSGRTGPPTIDYAPALAYLGSSPTLVNCAFVHNVAHGGGGMHNNGQFGYVSAPTLIDCVFVGNLATRGQTKSQWGGGVANGNEGNATLINCLFTGNKSHRGGAIGNYSSKPLIINCTLSGNVADFGGGLFNTQFSEPQLRNCVVWDNTGTQIYNREDLGANYPQVYYSCVQGGWSGAGGGNIHAAPVFVPGPGGCYYLSQVSAGQAVDSPCLDGGGDTAKYLGFNTVTTRSDEATDTGMVDMGYHYPVTGKPLVMGDFDRNLDVDLADFVGLQNCFTGDSPAGISPCCRVFDFEPDEDVDLTDYGAFEILFNP